MIYLKKKKIISYIIAVVLSVGSLSNFMSLYAQERTQSDTGEKSEISVMKSMENQNYAYNWYTSFDTAISDANSLSTANADSSEGDADCKAGLYVMDNAAHLVLADDCISDSITLNQDTELDLNGNNLSMSTNSCITFNKKFSLSNGTINFDSNLLIKTVNDDDFTLSDLEINNDYAFNSTSSSEREMSLIDVNSINIDIYETNYTSRVTNLYDSTSYNPKVTMLDFKNTGSSANIEGLTLQYYTCYKEKGMLCDSEGGNVIVCRGDLYITDSILNFNSVLKYGIYCAFNNNAQIICDNIEINSSQTIAMDYGIYISKCNKYIVKNSKIRGMSKGGIYGNYSNTAAPASSSVENNIIDIFKRGTMFGMRLGCCSKIINNTVTCRITQKTSVSAVNIVDGIINSVRTDEEMTEIYGNDIRCLSDIKETTNDGLDMTAYSGGGHIMSGYFFVDPVVETTNYANNNPSRCNVLGVGIRAGDHTIIDESKGKVTAVGGDFGIRVSGDCTINGGTFKAPCHGGGFIVPGDTGHTINIQGGVFENNKYEYDLNEYPQIAKCGDFGSFYLGYDKGTYSTEPWTLDLHNITIGNGRSGTYGLVFYATSPYVPPTTHLYNCNITGLANDIRLDRSSTSANAYCYIENGTTLRHDGTDQAWYDAYSTSGTLHIIDNRTQEEPTSEEATAAEPITEEATTAEPTIEEVTTAEPITEEATTVEPVTEEPETVEPVAEADFKIYSKTLALSSGISLIFKVNKSLFEKRYSDPKLVVVLDGIETEITEYTIDSNGRYAFEFTKITPDKMNVMVSVTLHAYKDGKEYVSSETNYSVAAYCYNMLAKYGDVAGFEKLRTLLVDLLNYGAASQNYTGFNTDNPVNSNLTAGQRSWGTEDLGELRDIKNGNYQTVENPGAAWKTVGLNLQDAVIIKMRFEAESIDGLMMRVEDDYGTIWDIESADFESVTGTANQYYVSFKEFNVGRMNDSAYFTLYKGNTPVSNTYRYSVESYVYAHQNDGNTLGELVKALMKYGNSAKAYISV